MKFKVGNRSDGTDAFRESDLSMPSKNPGASSSSKCDPGRITSHDVVSGRGRTIFIAGIMQRAGTNFLADLLSLHPDCEKSFVSEDFLVRRAEVLTNYVNATYNSWNPRWLVRKVNSKNLLLESIGYGLDLFLRQRIKVSGNDFRWTLALREPDASMKCVVSKTPDVDNLDFYSKLFPSAKLIVIVRDGRAAVESALRTFQWSFEFAIRKWKKGADNILAFDGSRSVDATHLMVRYEDLYSNVEREMNRILDFVHLSSSRYDFEQAGSMPVRGSSTYRVEEDNPWEKPLDVTDAFNPLARFENWSRFQHERFNWIAGDVLAQLGYPPTRTCGFRVFWFIYNCLADIRYGLTLGLKTKVKEWLSR